MSLFVKRKTHFSFKKLSNRLKKKKYKKRNAETKNKRKSERPISICKLNMSPCLHIRPINLVVYKGS